MGLQPSRTPHQAAAAQSLQPSSESCPKGLSTPIPHPVPAPPSPQKACPGLSQAPSPAPLVASGWQLPGSHYLPKAGLMKAGCRNTAAPRKVLRPSGVPLGGKAAEPGGGGGRLGKAAAAAAAAAAAVQAESRAGW